MCDRVLPWCLWASASSPLAPGEMTDFRCEGRALLIAEAMVSTVGRIVVGRVRCRADVLVQRGVGSEAGPCWWARVAM
jgi:hypothetical protein